MMVPLYGFLQGDTMGLTIVVHTTDTVATLVGRLQQAAHVRCAWDGDYDVVYRGIVLDPQLSVEDCGLEALERIDVMRKA